MNRSREPRRATRRDADDNAGDLGFNTEGDMTVGLGGGLTIDVTDGSLGVEVLPGFSIDLGD